MFQLSANNGFESKLDVKLYDEFYTTEIENVLNLGNDYDTFNAEFQSNLEKDILALSYPNGKFDTVSNVILRELGVKVTFATSYGNNTIIKGLPQSLYCLNRYNICEEITTEKLIELLSEQ